MGRLAMRASLLFRQPSLDRHETRTVLVVVLGITGLAILPGWIGPYSLSTLRDALILCVLALSLDYLWGRAHVLSLGHAAFFGIGAYGMAVATTKLAWGSAAGLALGIGTAVVVALTVGYFLIFAGVRLHFFAIITMALSLIAGQIAVSWSSVTGGDVGILGVPGLRFELAGVLFDFSGPLSTYYVVLGVASATLLGLWIACRANYGKVLAALGMNEFRARTLGHNTSLHLLVVFVVAASLAALAGALFAAASGVVAPDLFSAILSIEIIVWVAIGGRGTLVGPVVATFLVTRLQMEISSVNASLWPLVLGMIFVLQVVFFPDGLPALARGLRRLWSSGTAASGSSG
jgi:ABC-type branched-subunit amino acid transport system permease subunit